MSSLKIAFVPVTAANRFDTIQKNDADLLCEATSATLSRRAKVDFSIPTFIDGASLLSTDTTLRDLKGLTGKKVGVLGGTTTEERLRNGLKAANISAEVIPTKSHTDGIAMLDDGRGSAYFGDRSILLSLIKDSKAPKELGIADTYLTLEPYALALARGDDDFRLAVDTALSRIYRTGEIATIFEQSFGGRAKASDPIMMLYVISALPD